MSLGPTIARVRVAAVSLGLTILLGGCGTSSSSTPTAAGPTPGPAAAVSSTGSAGGSTGPDGTSSSPASSSPADGHNAADVTFATMMLVHHRGAITMADLAPGRAASPAVKSLAAQIEAEQTPEITEMSDWLAQWVPAGGSATAAASPTGMAPMSGMGGQTAMATTSGMAAMPGMMSDAQMSQLTAARGAEFDRLFLQLMIVHHQGALAMAAAETRDGVNPAARALATSIDRSQTAQIATMRQLLAAS